MIGIQSNRWSTPYCNKMYKWWLGEYNVDKNLLNKYYPELLSPFDNRKTKYKSYIDRLIFWLFRKVTKYLLKKAKKQELVDEIKMNSNFKIFEEYNKKMIVEYDNNPSFIGGQERMPFNIK